MGARFWPQVVGDLCRLTPLQIRLLCERLADNDDATASALYAELNRAFAGSDKRKKQRDSEPSDSAFEVKSK